MFIEERKNNNIGNDRKLVNKSIYELANLFGQNKYQGIVNYINMNTDTIYLSDRNNDYRLLDKNDRDKISIIKGKNNKYSIQCNAGCDKDIEYNVIKSLCKVLMTVRNGQEVICKHSKSAIGPEHYGIDDKKVYGKSLAHGTANLLTKMAMIKSQCPDLMEAYLEIGIFDTKENRWSFSEEVARKLTLGSLNYYDSDVNSKYATAVVSEEGLNSNINSLFLTSAIKNDFEFENDFNKNSKYTYKELCNKIDEIENLKNRNGEYDSDKCASCLDIIKNYEIVRTIKHFTNEKENNKSLTKHL